MKRVILTNEVTTADMLDCAQGLSLCGYRLHVFSIWFTTSNYIAERTASKMPTFDVKNVFPQTSTSFPGDRVSLLCRFALCGFKRYELKFGTVTEMWRCHTLDWVSNANQNTWTYRAHLSYMVLHSNRQICSGGEFVVVVRRCSCMKKLWNQALFFSKDISFELVSYQCGALEFWRGTHFCHMIHQNTEKSNCGDWVCGIWRSHIEGGMTT